MTSGRLSGEVLGTYRTLPSRVLGLLMVATAAVLAALTLADVARGHDEGLLQPVALVVGIAALSWVLFLRPRVRLRTDGVELANVLTDSVVPFAAVTEITHRWAFEVHDDQGRRHSAWAVPVRRELRRPGRLDDFEQTTRTRGSVGTTAQGVADVAHRALQRWRLDGGGLAAGPAPGPSRRLSPPAVVVLTAAVVLAALAVLL